jgi:hypothetical protein
VGRRCQERGEFLEGGIALEGEALIEETRLRSDISRSRSIGELFSLVGEVDIEEPVNASIASWVSICGGSEFCRWST